MLTPLTFIFVVLDLLRYRYEPFGKFFYTVFGYLLRNHERDRKKKTLNGATYVLISATLVIIVFPKVLVVTAFSVLILADLSAALIGRKYGSTKFLYKSLQGTLTFFVVGSVIVLFTPKIEGLAMEYAIGLIGVAVGAIVENISANTIDDNLTIPVSICLTMWILYLILLPQLELVLPGVPG